MRIMKKFKVFILSLLLILIPSLSKATTFNSQNINVELLDNGDAIVTNYMDYYDDKGTEHYIVMGNLADSEIKDFKVSKNGEEYTTIPNWNVDASREEKSGKAGIYNAGSHLELCFGIGEYGDNNFIVSYRITNAVKNLNDAQMFFFRLINDDLSEPPLLAKATIKGPQPFTQDDVRMWAFGFEGNINLVDGNVVLESNGPMTTNSHMTPLVRFNPGYFNTTSNHPKNFSEVLEVAFEGSSYDKEAINEFDGSGGETAAPIVESPSKVSSTGNVFRFFRLFAVIPMMIIGLIASKLGTSKKKINGVINAKSRKDTYFRDVPYDGSIEDVFWLAKSAGLSDYHNYISAYFLKWIKDGIVEPVSYESGKIFKKEKVAFKILKNEINKEQGKLQEGEEKFFTFLLAAAQDYTLDDKEFTKWVRKSSNNSKFEDFIDDLDFNSRIVLTEKGYINTVTSKFLGIESKKYELTDKGMELNKNLIDFKNYLLDYSLLNERESINVHLWDELMIYAAIFGIADKVEKEFEKLYPAYQTESVYNYNTIMWANMYSNSIRNSFASASSSSSSSGFGGGSSFGGGGGSFGGGSGGGTR